MTQTLLEESKLLTTSAGSNQEKDENLSLITATDLDLRTICAESNHDNHKSSNQINLYNGNLSPKDIPCEDTRENITVSGLNSIDGYKLTSEKNSTLSSKFKHLYPEVVVQSVNDLSDLDSDEEDFQLRMHRKNDSGQGSSVETSSLKSSGTQELYQVDINFHGSNEHAEACSNSNTDILNNVLDDSDLSLDETFSRRHSSITSRIQEFDGRVEDTNFTDIPLNTPSPARQALNTYTPVSSNSLASVDHIQSNQRISLKPPTVTDAPVNQKYVRLFFFQFGFESF